MVFYVSRGDHVVTTQEIADAINSGTELDLTKPFQIKQPSGTSALPSDAISQFISDTTRRILYFDTVANVCSLQMRRVNGTLTTPTKILSGEQLGNITWKGWQETTSAFNFGGVLRCFATEDWTSTANGSRATIDVVPEGSIIGSSTFQVYGNSDVISGTLAVLATNATHGFIYIPTSAGTPSGVATSYTGKVALEFDTTNNILYVYDAGWVAISGGGTANSIVQGNSDVTVTDTGANGLVEIRTDGVVAIYWNSSQNTIITETKKLYLDSGVDAYIWVPSAGADRIEILSGGTNPITFQHSNTGFIMERNANLDVVIRKTATAAVGEMGNIYFQANRTTGGNTVFGRIESTVNSISNTSYSGQMNIKLPVSGVEQTFISMVGATAQINLGISGGSVGFFGGGGATIGTSGANLTNSVTSGGTTDTISDFTSLTVYATDAATIRNDIYQLARKLKQVNDALRAYGLLT